MEKYKEFHLLLEQLEKAYDDINKSQTRKEAEKAEVQARKVINALTIKLPYMHGAFHDIAARKRSEITTAELSLIKEPTA